MTAKRGQHGCRTVAGFSLRELLVVVGIIAILITLVAGYVSMNWKMARRVNCMSNMRQVTAGFFQYVADNDGYMPQCDGNVIKLGLGTGNGLVDLPYLDQYIGDPRVFHCPEDLRTDARTYAINDYLGGQYLAITHQMLLQRVANAPSTMLLIEEQAPITRNSYLGGFVVLPAPITRWADTPAVLHDKGTCLAFADGHVEYWHWDDPRTLNLPTTPFPNTPANPDLVKLQQVAGSKSSTTN